MRSRGLVWLVVSGLFLLHFLLHVGFGLGRGAPDLLTVALLLAAREVGVGTAAGTGFLFGLLEDSLSVLSFGANGVAMSLVGLAGAVTRDLFVGDSLFFLVSYFVLGKFVRDLLHWVVVGDAVRQPFLEHVLLQGLLGGLYAALVGLAVMAVTGLWREGPR
ncbi:MAG TPA: rod shape-determining protein MreD [Longimicrobiales bacterium]|nr:rod shape-determining protein MreD [Longimicrobiales bacterium]